MGTLSDIEILILPRQTRVIFMILEKLTPR